MSHIALYRKWRPLTFSDVLGQGHITGALKAQVESAHISHAYLFTGTRGTGKTTCAKILARAACCQNPIDGDPCNECPACKMILNDSALDVTEIDAASNNGVDSIRDLRDEATYAPTALKKRVYIIDEVHMLSPGAFNALLKTLEEPPEYVLFILATTEVHKIPATILSRCQRYDFRRITDEVIGERLMQIAQDEGINLYADACATLARLADGSMRDGISLFERCAGLQEMSHASVLSLLGLPSKEAVIGILSAVADKNHGLALERFGAAYAGGFDMVSLFSELLSLIRDIYIIKATNDKRLVFDAEQVGALSKAIDLDMLEHYTDCISLMLARMTRTALKRFDCEICLMKMCAGRQSAGQTAAGAISAPRSAAAAPPSGGQRQDAPPAQTLPPQAEGSLSEKPGESAGGLAPAPADQGGAPSAEDLQKNGQAEGGQAPAGASVPEGSERPPWEDDGDPAPEQEMPEPKRAGEEAAAPREPEVQKDEPQAPQSGVGDVLRDDYLKRLSPRLAGGVKAFLQRAEIDRKDDTLILRLPKEGMIFVNKPRVLAILNEEAGALGFAKALVEEIKEEPPQAGLLDIMKKAEDLGIPIIKE